MEYDAVQAGRNVASSILEQSATYVSCLEDGWWRFIRNVGKFVRVLDVLSVTFKADEICAELKEMMLIVVMPRISWKSVSLQ